MVLIHSATSSSAWIEPIYITHAYTLAASQFASTTATPQHTAAFLVAVLFAAGVACAARDLDYPGRQLPPYSIPGVPAGFYGPGGFGGGWGAGFGGPGGGGYAHGGVEVPTLMCSEKGPCYGKKVSCPQKCFWSYGRSGNGYGAGGGGGSCTVDCKTNCTATC